MGKKGNWQGYRKKIRGKERRWKWHDLKAS